MSRRGTNLVIVADSESSIITSSICSQTRQSSSSIIMVSPSSGEMRGNSCLCVIQFITRHFIYVYGAFPLTIRSPFSSRRVRATHINGLSWSVLSVDASHASYSRRNFRTGVIVLYKDSRKWGRHSVQYR